MTASKAQGASVSVGDFLKTPTGQIVLVATALGGGAWGGQYITASQLEDKLESSRTETEKMITEAAAEGYQNGRLESLEAVTGNLLGDVKDLYRGIETLNKADEKHERLLDNHGERIGTIERRIQ
jgi:hypothetical protein